MLDLSNLQPPDGAKRKRKRVGRGPGSGHGKTSGKGHKGQKARSGYTYRPGFEGGQMPLRQRLPKSGFTQVPRHAYAEINVDVLNDNFSDGDEVTRDRLLEMHLVKKSQGGLKVLGRGELTKKLTVKADAISATAREKIEAAGGSVEIKELPTARAVKNRKPKGKAGK
jgi:large subunit ribosomal protein L15